MPSFVDRGSFQNADLVEGEFSLDVPTVSIVYKNRGDSPPYFISLHVYGPRQTFLQEIGQVRPAT